MRTPILAGLARRLLVQWASGLREGRLMVEFPHGGTAIFGPPAAPRAAHIRILDDAFFTRVLLHGEIGFGEAYTDGLWCSDDLVALLELGIANRRHASRWMRSLGKLASWRDRLQHLRRRNTVRTSRRNISEHYDLSNDLFRTFLDDTMTYSCAVFAQEEQSLAEAQLNKYRRMCELASIQRGESVLEIGTGWGGFALYAARNYACDVTSITISKEQHELALRRVEEADLASQVDVRLCDYRRMTGRFDRIVSIEMFEAVGAEYFAIYFRKCDDLLRPGGRLAMQVITVPDRAFEGHRRGVNWLQKHIFPGGLLPSFSAMEKALASTSLLVSRVEDIGSHYALTLRQWRSRFNANLERVRRLGFDDSFARKWEYYLASCEAAFRTRTIGDLQIAFDKTAG